MSQAANSDLFPDLPGGEPIEVRRYDPRDPRPQIERRGRTAVIQDVEVRVPHDVCPDGDDDGEQDVHDEGLFDAVWAALETGDFLDFGEIRLGETEEIAFYPPAPGDPDARRTPVVKHHRVGQAVRWPDGFGA